MLLMTASGAELIFVPVDFGPILGQDRTAEADRHTEPGYPVAGCIVQICEILDLLALQAKLQESTEVGS
ncbi:MAG: hypothetical protein ACYCV7_01200 [Acidimicrobiales bacterium]